MKSNENNEESNLNGWKWKVIYNEICENEENDKYEILTEETMKIVWKMKY